MGFKVDHSSPIYKRFRLKALGMTSSPRLILVLIIIHTSVMAVLKRMEMFGLTLL